MERSTIRCFCRAPVTGGWQQATPRPLQPFSLSFVNGCSSAQSGLCSPYRIRGDSWRMFKLM